MDDSFLLCFLLFVNLRDKGRDGATPPKAPPERAKCEDVFWGSCFFELGDTSVRSPKSEVHGAYIYIQGPPDVPIA